jgi:hypothetical protein
MVVTSMMNLLFLFVAKKDDKANVTKVANIICRVRNRYMEARNTKKSNVLFAVVLFKSCAQ